MSEKIFVTKSFLPPIEEYESYLRLIWENGQLTNQGKLLRQFESETEEYLGVDNFQFVSNGTIAMQIALRALDITEGEIITTPFTYVATTSAIMWERCTPVYVDIDPESLCIDTKKIEASITPKTKAILAVHVFGNPCDVKSIETIAKKHNLKVIYDAAHAFGVNYSGKSLLDFGDISTCSFHATKLFHTIEGGGIVANGGEINKKIDLIKRFGHDRDDHKILGINAKTSEFNAAMGLSNLKYISDIIEKRRAISELYDDLLGIKVKKPSFYEGEGSSRNYAYYPIILDSEGMLLKVKKGLEAEEIFPRRYFYPSLNKLNYVESSARCSVSEDIASRILCLPIFYGLSRNNVERISKIILQAL